MFQFIESICIEDGFPRLLELHQARLDRTFLEHYPDTKPHVLASLLSTVLAIKKTKCRVLYNADSVEIELINYAMPSIESLQVVDSNSIEYSFKYHDRSWLSKLYNQKGERDDVLIVKNGFVTDSYFANIAFYDGEHWLTPENPLLKGIKRQHLINQKRIIIAPIKSIDIKKFEKVSLINAMIELDELSIDIQNIYY